jgi:hypothetical protein
MVSVGVENRLKSNFNMCQPVREFLEIFVSSDAHEDLINGRMFLISYEKAKTEHAISMATMPRWRV